MAGASPISPAQMADFIERISKFTNLTFTEACRAVGKPSQTAYYWRVTLAPKMQAQHPEMRLTFPQFKGGGGEAARPFVPQYEPPPAPPAEPIPAWEPPTPPRSETASKVEGLLRKAPRTLEEIAAAVNVTPGAALDFCLELRKAGLNVMQAGERWTLGKAMEPAFASRDSHELLSDDNNRFRFGVVADSHLGSKYERLDALHDIYDRFVAEGITHVYHAGNWIEGEARFNVTDLAVHGMEEQLKYLAKNYPQRPDITTFAVTGDDHEGWYAQRGVDIGKRAEQTMREAGRKDWVDLGYMEAHVLLKNANTGKTATMAVVHPGGGSAYADSYVVQKIIESLDGGEKPALALYGHYHKMLAGEYRNVFWVLVPSTKDQDVFMRKKRIRSVVGGGIVEVSQYPDDGALHSFKPWLWRYFNKAYYGDGQRWSHTGPVSLPERVPT